MSQDISSTKPKEVRFLQEFDLEHVPDKKKAGIKLALNPIIRFFGRLFGTTVNIEVGTKTYSLGRKSLEHFLDRHRHDAGIQDDGHKLSYDELAKGLRNFLQANKQQFQVIKPGSKELQNLYKDLKGRQFKILGNYYSEHIVDLRPSDIQVPLAPERPVAQDPARSVPARSALAGKRIKQNPGAAAVSFNPRAMRAGIVSDSQGEMISERSTQLKGSQDKSTPSFKALLSQLKGQQTIDQQELLSLFQAHINQSPALGNLTSTIAKTFGEKLKQFATTRQVSIQEASLATFKAFMLDNASGMEQYLFNNFLNDTETHKILGLFLKNPQ